MGAACMDWKVLAAYNDEVTILEQPPASMHRPPPSRTGTPPLSALASAACGILMLGSCLHASAAESHGGFRLPEDPSWVKRPSGKHRIQHVYDVGTSKDRIVGKDVPRYRRAFVGMAISRDGTYGTAEIKSGPYSHCQYTAGARDCSLTVTKGKVRRRFAFHTEWSSTIVIDDMQGFVALVDGPEHFSIAYLDEKAKQVILNF